MVMQPVVSLTQQLVRLDTVNPPGNEADAVRLVAPLLTAAGFQVKQCDYGPNRMSLVAHKGRTASPGRIRLLVAFWPVTDCTVGDRQT